MQWLLIQGNVVYQCLHLKILSCLPNNTTMYRQMVTVLSLTVGYYQLSALYFLKYKVRERKREAMS